MSLFNSSKKRSKNFCPSRLGQKYEFSSSFLEELKTQKRHFEINWPLAVLEFLGYLIAAQLWCTYLWRHKFSWYICEKRSVFIYFGDCKKWISHAFSNLRYLLQHKMFLYGILIWWDFSFILRCCGWITIKTKCVFVLGQILFLFKQNSKHSLKSPEKYIMIRFSFYMNRTNDKQIFMIHSTFNIT